MVKKKTAEKQPRKRDKKAQRKQQTQKKAKSFHCSLGCIKPVIPTEKHWTLLHGKEVGEFLACIGNNCKKCLEHKGKSRKKSVRKKSVRLSIKVSEISRKFDQIPA